jgi:hypothetical protein
MNMRCPALPLPSSFPRSGYARALCLSWALTCAALATGCGTAQSALPFIPADAPLRYSTYFNAQGQLRGEEWALALMGHPSHREQVFLQLQQGLFPASEAWLTLETVCRGAGALLAQEHARPACTLLPAEAGCEFNWNPVRALLPGEGPGRQRLLDTYKEGYDARWAQVQPGFHARAESARAAMLMAGATLGRTPAAAESRAVAAEGRAAGAESRAAAAEGRALGAETRALAAEGEAAGARTARLVSAESLGLRRALSAEEASILETRLLELEAESVGRREAFSAAELHSGRLAPRPSPSKLSAEDALRWNEFEAYRQRRFQEVRSQWRGGKSTLSVKPPLRWEDYRQFRNHFQSCIEFESRVGGILLRELEQPASARRVLRDSQQPLLARHVGTKKSGQEGVRYPDFLAVDEATLKEGSAPRVESVSVKKRDFSRMSAKEVHQQATADALEAMNKYGGSLEVRRSGHPLFGQTVPVSQVHLIYDIRGIGTWRNLLQETCRQEGVKVHFE